MESESIWDFDSAASADFVFRQHDNDRVLCVAIAADSVGVTFATCIKQDPGNQITSVLLSGIDEYVQAYFGTGEPPARAKKARTSAPAPATVRDNNELPLAMYLECVIDGSGRREARERVRETATAWFGTQLASGGAPSRFLRDSGVGRRVASYRLWVFVRHESSMSVTLQGAMVAFLKAPADRHTWITACQRYRPDLSINALAGAPLDSSANNASPQRVLDARTQLGPAAGQYVSANSEWLFPHPARVLKVPLELLVGGGGVRRNFLLQPPPLVQFGACGLPLVVQKLYSTDTLLARLAQQSRAGAAVAQWLVGGERRFSERFRRQAVADAELSAFANHIVEWVSLFDSALGAFKCHQLLLTAVLASHTAYQPASSGLRAHVLLCGPHDQSKSFVLEQVEHMSVPGAVSKFTRETLRVFENAGPVRDDIKLIDEMNDDLVHRHSRSDAKTVFKSMLTSGEIHTQRCFGTKVVPRHDIKHTTLLAGTNVAVDDLDLAIASRFVVVNTATTAGQQRRDERTQPQQLARVHQADSVAQRADLYNDAQCIHALVVLTETAIADGTLTDISLEVLPLVYDAYCAELHAACNKQPGNRVYQQVRALTRILVIHAALRRLYTDARWPCHGATLSPHHVLLLQPLLVDSVQICSLAIDLVAWHLVSPADEHSALMRSALAALAVRPGRLLCGHRAADDLPYALATREVGPAAHADAELLDDRAVRARLALVRMPATAQYVQLFHNSLTRL
jgi:hypothetical protein